MSAAYLDSSFLLSIVFGEPRAATHRRILARHERLISSDLIVAECLSAAARERVDRTAVIAALRPIDLVMPARSLAHEMTAALDEGYLRGADLWHVACAMFLAGDDRKSLPFLSRDESQRQVAKGLGFPTP